jgi:hypothetical protein
MVLIVADSDVACPLNRRDELPLQDHTGGHIALLPPYKPKSSRQRRYVLGKSLFSFGRLSSGAHAVQHRYRIFVGISRHSTSSIAESRKSGELNGI